MTFREILDVYRGYRIPHFRLIEHKRRWFIASGIVIALSIVGLSWTGLEYSIDFEGGTRVSYPLLTDATVEEIREAVATAGFDASEVQIVTDENGRTVQIRTQAVLTAGPPSSGAPSATTSPSPLPSATPSPHSVSESAAGVEDLRTQLADQAGIEVDEINVEDIGPTWGTRISRQALTSLLIALACIGAYIALRFEWTMAVGAMVALVHDVIITAGIYALTGREVTPETVIAILTILGFSLYDTVVIYDKIKENTESPALVARLGYDGVIDLSLNQTIMRSVNTSLVVLLPILSLLLFGGETLKDFAFAMFVGVAVGAYSSIFIAAPLLTLLHRRQGRRAAPARPVPVGVSAARSPAPATATGSGAAAAATVKQSGSSRPAPKNKRRPPPKRKRR